MKKVIISLVVACCALLQVRAAELSWSTDVPQAVAKAKAADKLVLLDFTGSDWCGWCIKFKSEALDTKEFQEYAGKNLVLVELDFPRKTEQSADLKAANKTLAEKYNVNGFPTFVVLNKDGKEIGRQVGYQEGGPKAFIAEIEGFKK
jgi:protein disulfide-isomerase